MNWRRLLFIPPLLVGVAIFYAMTRPDEAAETTARPEASVAVRAIEVKPKSFRPTASGYGRMQAERSWQAISQVDGRIVTAVPNLAIGSIIQAGQTIYKIDARDYEIALAKADAGLASAEAQLKELDAQADNTRASLDLERKIERLRQSEFDRVAALVERGTSSQAVLDAAGRQLFSQKRQVLNLENSLSLLPVQRLSLEASLRTREVEREEALRNLENTVVRAPFTGRVADENLAVGQYARPGDRILTIEDTSSSEVAADFQPASIGAMVRAFVGDNIGSVLGPNDFEAALAVLKKLSLTATVHIDFGGLEFEWPAELVRLSGRVDDITGAIGIVFRVDDPGRPHPAQNRPPLNNGSFVEVRLTAPAKENTLLIPRETIRIAGGKRFVYTADADDRLQRRLIETGPVIGDEVIVRSGLAPGDRVVLSEPQPTVIGMLLDVLIEPTALLVTN